MIFTSKIVSLQMIKELVNLEKDLQMEDAHVQLIVRLTDVGAERQAYHVKETVNVIVWLARIGEMRM